MSGLLTGGGRGGASWSHASVVQTAGTGFTWQIPSGVQELEIIGIDIGLSVNADLIGALLRESDDGYASFNFMQYFQTNAVGNTTTGSDAALFRHTVVGAPNDTGFHARILNPRSSSIPTTATILSMATGAGTANEEFMHTHLVAASAEDHDAFSALPSTGTMTGTFHINWR